MSRLVSFSKDTAKKFSVDDWIGLAETIFGIIKKCREERQSKQQIKGTVRDGIFAKLRVRRALKANLDRGEMSLRQMNRLADHIIEAAQADEAGLDAVLNEIDDDGDDTTTGNSTEPL